MSSRFSKGITPIFAAEIVGFFLVVFTAVYFGLFHQYAVGPTPSPTASSSSPDCYYHQVQCIRAPCNPEPICPTAGSYVNQQFGFTIPLTDDWKGYTANHTKDDIYDVSGSSTSSGQANNGVVDSFQLIEIHYPGDSQNPHEVMPIMVFTPEQWGHIQKEEWSVGAAPIPPSVLGRNQQYVLALPARYNYDYKEGWQEVDELVHQLQAFEPQSAVPSKSTEPIFCTQEAKQCPDGSYVGRTGPNCEFAPCPGESK